MRFINLLQSLFHDMGINLGGGYVRVAQHHLYRTKIRAAVQQVRGEAVPQHMWRQSLTQSRFSSITAEKLPENNAIDGRAGASEEKTRRGFFAQDFRTRFFQVLLNRFEGAATDGHEAFFITLPDAPQAANFHLQVGRFQSAELGYSQAGRIQQFDHGFIAQAGGGIDVRLGEQAVHFLYCKEFGQSLAEFRSLDIDCRVLVDESLGKSEAEKVANSDQMTGYRAAVQLAKIEGAQEVHDVPAFDLVCCEFLLGGELGKLCHVAAVGLDGIRREPFFDSQVVQE